MKHLKNNINSLHYEHNSVRLRHGHLFSLLWDENQFETFIRNHMEWDIANKVMLKLNIKKNDRI